MKPFRNNRLIAVLVFTCAAAAAMAYWIYLRKPPADSSFASGNGRIEATEVSIAAKYPGRLTNILVQEGDMVKAGQTLAVFDTKELNARLQQAEAQVEEARQKRKYALAVVQQRKSELALAQKNLERSKNLYVNKNISLVQLQQHETAMETAQAALAAANAQSVSAQAAITAALAQVEAVQINLEDQTLISPIDGRVLYRVAEPGEVIASGGTVLVLLELTDVYMTIFLPMAQAGRVVIGAESRIVLDALPDKPVPARVSFVSPESQFTPKEIETKTEREKLMFRVKVAIDRDLLKAHVDQVKTGLPGVAHIRLDHQAPWPEELKTSFPVTPLRKAD